MLIKRKCSSFYCPSCKGKRRWWEAKKPEDSDAFSEVEHWTPVAVLSWFYLCSNDLCGPIIKYIYVSEKHPFTCCPAAKHQNAANIGLQKYEKNQ